jgi:purine-binding chemotaxis protein CheW
MMQRAQAPEVNALSTDATLPVLTFRCRDQLYGVSVVDVKEVTLEPIATPIAHMPSEVLGYVNIRGQILLAICLGTLMKLPATEKHQRQFVIFKPKVGASFGIIVDSMGEIYHLNVSDIQVTAPISEDNAQEDSGSLVRGIHQTGDEVMVLLEPRSILPFIDQRLNNIR